jgi:type VI secretion system protein ImpA
MTLLEKVFPELDSLMEPIAGASPTGRDLDGSLELNALESACAEPEEAILAGVDRTDTRDWRAIRVQACQLLTQSKDLRVVTQLSRALLQIEGLPGFCAGLGFLTLLAQRYWAELYPVLDLHDSGAIERISPIQELVSRPVLAHVRLALLFSEPGLRKITVNDLLVATASPLGRPDLVQAPSHEAFAALESLGVTAMREHLLLLDGARQQLTELQALLSTNVGVHLQLDALASSRRNQPGLLDAVSRALEQECVRLSPESASAAAGSDEERGSEARATTGRSSTDISRREDVVMMLDRICAYYSRVEPSSPVPLLLQRAKRVAMMDFLAIVRDLADQGLDQVGVLAGISVK